MVLGHVKFIARTVLVKDGNVDAAAKVVNRLLAQDGIFDTWRRTRFYEKPYQMRRRVNYQKCKSVYDEDMARKIQFILRKNRNDPYPGCY